MTRILLAGRHLSSRAAFKNALDQGHTRTTCLASGDEVLSAISENRFDLLVADETLDDMSGLALIESVVARQPTLNCAVVSSLSHGDFHQASEGLGVLMQLPVNPGKREALQLFEHLIKIQSFSKGVTPRGKP
jgi:DNA-binding NtrC family response regulator